MGTKRISKLLELFDGRDANSARRTINKLFPFHT